MFDKRINHLRRTPVNSHTWRWYVKKIFRYSCFDWIQMKDERTAEVCVIHRHTINIIIIQTIRWSRNPVIVSTRRHIFKCLILLTVWVFRGCAFRCTVEDWSHNTHSSYHIDYTRCQRDLIWIHYKQHGV